MKLKLMCEIILDIFVLVALEWKILDLALPLQGPLAPILG
jgi:hypothetical protein